MQIELTLYELSVIQYCLNKERVETPVTTGEVAVADLEGRIASIIEMDEEA